MDAIDMEVKIKQGYEMIDATIEMVNGVMVVSPKGVKYMYKVGEVIFVRSIYKHICIYKESANGCLYSSVDLVEDIFDINDTPVCYECDITEIRPATEGEKKKLFDKLAEEGYEWDAEKKELVKLKWKPKYGDIYYRPSFCASEFYVYGNTFSDVTEATLNPYINKGWLFKTEKECQELVDKLNQAIEGVKL